MYIRCARTADSLGKLNDTATNKPPWRHTYTQTPIRSHTQYLAKIKQVVPLYLVLVLWQASAFRDIIGHLY